MSHVYAVLLIAHVQRKDIVIWMDHIVDIYTLFLLTTKLIY